MAIVLFDTERRTSFYPLTYTKAVADLSFGLFTIRERWQKLLEDDIYIETDAYLQVLYPLPPEAIHTWINACVLPLPPIVDAIKKMQQGDVFEDTNGIISCKGKGRKFKDVLEQSAMNFTTIAGAEWLLYPHHLLRWNETNMQSDFYLLTKNKTSQSLSLTNQILGKENIFIAEGANVEFAM